MTTPNPTPDRPPLWRVMGRAAADARAAYYPFAPSDRVLAAEIRAVRDWLVPEELDPPVPGPHEQCAGSRWAERQRLRALLTAEADRAERNDG